MQVDSLRWRPLRSGAVGARSLISTWRAGADKHALVVAPPQSRHMGLNPLLTFDSADSFDNARNGAPSRLQHSKSRGADTDTMR